MSPRSFYFLRQRRREVQRHSDFMLAQIRAGVENFSMMRGKDWRQPREFMPTEQKARPPRRLPQHSRAAIASAFRSFAQDYGAKQP